MKGAACGSRSDALRLSYARKMPALLARSQSIEVERFTAFGPRFFDESLKLRMRTRIV
jgi:hypothetical protein